LRDGRGRSWSAAHLITGRTNAASSGSTSAIDLGLSILNALDDGIDPQPVIEAGQQFAKVWEQEYGTMPIGAARASYCDAGAYFLRAWAAAEPDRAEALIASAEQLEMARDINLATVSPTPDA
jgi:hypothetical protein